MCWFCHFFHAQWNVFHIDAWLIFWMWFFYSDLLGVIFFYSEFLGYMIFFTQIFVLFLLIFEKDTFLHLVTFPNFGHKITLYKIVLILNNERCLSFDTIFIYLCLSCYKVHGKHWISIEICNLLEISFNYLSIFFIICTE